MPLSQVWVKGNSLPMLYHYMGMDSIQSKESTRGRISCAAYQNN